MHFSVTYFQVEKAGIINHRPEIISRWPDRVYPYQESTHVRITQRRNGELAL